MSHARWQLFTVVAVGFVAALAGIGARATYGAQVTADEPQYLLSAISVAEDGDLDIADELEQRRWRAFHEAELPTQTAVLSDGRRISPHDPLLPVLIVPGVIWGGWLGSGWVGAKVVLALVAAALAGLTWWTAIRRFGVRPRAATIGVAVFAASMPLAPYGTQIYPEQPAALLAVGIVALITGVPRRLQVIGSCALLVLLPWLAIKYAPVAASLGIVAVVRWWRQGHRGAVTGALITAAAAGLAWVAIHEAVWTGVTSYASADLFAERGEFSAVGFAPDLWGRARRLIGLIIGRDFGLASWQPAWLLLVPSLAALVVRRPTHWLSIAVPLITGWLVATFVALTMQGWWVPGRQVVVVLPLAAIAISWWADQGAKRLWALALLGVTGVLAWLLLAWEASTGQLTLVVDFMDTGDPLLGLWRGMLPAYLSMDTGQWIRHGLWTLVAVLTVAAVVVRHSWRGVRR